MWNPAIRMPSYVKRRHWWSAALVVPGVLLLMFGAESIRAITGKPGEAAEWVTAGAFLAIFAGFQVWWYRSKWSLRRRGEAAEYTLCTQCAYDISTLERTQKEGPDGRHVRCPECGTLVDAREARSIWREYLTN